MSLAVVNLGLPKTGTTTLGRALKLAGFRVADHRIRPRQTEDKTLHHAFVGDLLYRGYYETGDPAAHLTGFTAISEMSCLREGHSLWPQMDFGLIEALRLHHPGLRFVASRRGDWDVAQSILGWSDLGTQRLPAADIPGLPAGYGATGKERETWIAAHYAHLGAIFRDDPAYLELDITAPDAPAQLAAHIGVEIPWWGKTNTARHGLAHPEAR